MISMNYVNTQRMELSDRALCSEALDSVSSAERGGFGVGHENMLFLPFQPLLLSCLIYVDDLKSLEATSFSERHQLTQNGELDWKALWSDITSLGESARTDIRRK